MQIYVFFGFCIGKVNIFLNIFCGLTGSKVDGLIEDLFK